jgi:hypothetical protein
MVEAFCPADTDWRGAVERAGVQITEKAISGLQRWT